MDYVLHWSIGIIMSLMIGSASTDHAESINVNDFEVLDKRGMMHLLISIDHWHSNNVKYIKYCQGAMIAPYYAITAGSCVHARGLINNTAVTISQPSTWEGLRSVYILLHENFNASEYNIALIEFQKNVKSNIIMDTNPMGTMHNKNTQIECVSQLYHVENGRFIKKKVGVHYTLCPGSSNNTCESQRFFYLQGASTLHYNFSGALEGSILECGNTSIGLLLSVINITSNPWIPIDGEIHETPHAAAYVYFDKVLTWLKNHFSHTYLRSGHEISTRASESGEGDTKYQKTQRKRAPNENAKTAPGGHHNGTAPGGHHNGTAPGGHHNGTAPGGHHDGTAPGGHNNGTAPGGHDTGKDEHHSGTEGFYPGQTAGQQFFQHRGPMRNPVSGEQHIAGGFDDLPLESATQPLSSYFPCIFIYLLIIILM